MFLDCHDQQILVAQRCKLFVELLKRRPLRVVIGGEICSLGLIQARQLMMWNVQMIFYGPYAFKW